MSNRAWLASIPVCAAIVAAQPAPAAADEVCISPEVTAVLSSCAGVAARAPAAAKASFSVPVAPPPKQPAKAAPPPDPQLSAVQIRRGLANLKSIQLLVAQIQQLESLLAATALTAADRPGLIRRLADSYVELEAANARKKIEGRASAAEQKRQNPGKAAAAESEAARAEAIEVASRKAAIKHYGDLKAQHPRWCQNPGPPASGCVDETLYNLAYEHEAGGDAASARTAYLDLIQSSPTSRYVPHAYLAFGELFFQEAQGDPAKWPLAEQSYKEVAKYPAPENAVLGYAQYKLAYVYWNKGDYAQAITQLKKTIELGARFPAMPNVAPLGSSARRDLLPLYALAGDPRKAWDFFHALSGDAAGQSALTLRLVGGLGQSYLDIGRYADAVEVYQDLLRRDRGPRSCGYQAHLTEAVLAQKTGDKAAAKAELDRQIQAEQRFRGEGHGDELKLACASATASLVAETAMIWHLEATGAGSVRGTMSKETMALADDLYEKLIKQFTAADFARFEFPRLVRQDWPTLLKIKANRAELLYAQKAWDRCGPAFDAVVAEEPKGPEAASSAYASALCYERAYLAANAGKPARLERGGEGVAPKEITPLQKAMLASFDRFLCVADPRSADKEERENAIEVAYARARVYFEAHRFPEAAAAFRAVALQHSDHEIGIYAAQLYLEALNVMGSHGKPACYGDMRRDLPEIQRKYCDGKQNAEQCGVLGRVQRDVGWQIVEDRAKQAKSAKEWEDVAEAYLALWNEQGKEACASKQPACERMDQVLFNSAKAFAAARLVAKAIAVRKILLDPRYGLDRTPVGRQTALDIGKSYQAIAVYDEAAAFYERFAADSPADEKAPTALQDAIALRLGLGQEEQAKKDAELFDRSYRQKHPAEAARIAFSMGAHHAEHDNLAEARRRLTGAMGEIDRSAPIDVQIQAHAVLGRVLWKTGGETGAAAEFAKVRALYRDPAAVVGKLRGEGDERRLARTLTAVGEALFYAAEQRRKGVDAIKFPAYRGSGRREDVLAHIQTKVDAWMKKKMPAIEEAEREYRRVLDVTPEPPPRWVIASGARVGQLWGRFVAEFRAAPVPKEWLQTGPSPYGDLTWEEIRFAYLAAIDEKSEPYRKRAKEAYKACLSYSTRYQHFDESSRSCEVWLAKNYGAEYHVIDELRGTPSRIAADVPSEPLALAAPVKP